MRGKTCLGNDKSCECSILGRECDPDICRHCGVNEVLDPVNRYCDVTGKCNNANIQKGVPRRTILGDSKLLASAKLPGLGLYMGETVKKGSYLGEYVGEIISKEEAERRGIAYNKRNMSYLFDLNKSKLTGTLEIFLEHRHRQA